MKKGKKKKNGTSQPKTLQIITVVLAILDLILKIIEMILQRI